MFKIKNEVERLQAWRLEHAGSMNWEADQKEEFKDLFNMGPSIYCIQFPKREDAVYYYKLVHFCSLQVAVKAIAAGEEQLSMEGKEL